MRYLVTGAQMRAMDQHTIAQLGVPGVELMRRAGTALFQLCQARLLDSTSVVFLCGKGNNGGDGFIAAQLFQEQAVPVRVFVFAPRAEVGGDAKLALESLEENDGLQKCDVYFHGAAEFEVALSKALGENALVVDALLGTGLSRPVREPILSVIERINASGCSVISVDIPSGVDAASGAILGEAINADATLTFAFEKRGHHQYPGAACAGELVCDDIGIPESLAQEFDVDGWLLEPCDGPALFPPRRPDSHKGSYGHLGVWAGSQAMPGAAVLTLLGALRSGVGLVSWLADSATIARARALPPEVMLREHLEVLDANFWKSQLTAFSAVVVGPGLGREQLLESLEQFLGQCSVPICLDADALSVVASKLELLKASQASLVLTPHPKELSRLCGLSVAEIQDNRIEVAQEFAARHELTLVLKGARSVVASCDGSVAVIGAGNPGLATGGSGDVLAGVIGAFLAQGLKPFTAAQLGALLHACAGDAAANRAGEAGMVATDIVEGMKSVLTQWNR